jgi:hypothetical protein
VHRALNVAHAHGYVIDAFEFHTEWNLPIAQIETTKRCKDGSHFQSSSCEIQSSLCCFQKLWECAVLTPASRHTIRTAR